MPSPDLPVAQCGHGMRHQPGALRGWLIPSPLGPPSGHQAVIPTRSDKRMGDEITRYRLSILVFDEAARLWRTLADLLESGVTAAQVCLIGLTERLQALELPRDMGPGTTGQLAAILYATQVRLPRQKHADLAARCGSQTESFLGRSASMSGPFRWLRKELDETLGPQSDTGAIILLVCADSAEQQSATARLLLRHGQHALKTHEFSWPQTGQQND